ncbi:autotransporter domain-containing protein [Erythrobacter sp.]|uniref:autotransporter domain-containing protein n=1 Tax=Erythrobacter sp. TaxID=1042 RepID=UPI001425E68C|nr:autotransporter domain-containing protein [Erythrobacter sp.]QIQ86842.1 MAG: autotransporter domain-containing protein [Erythrobacter sp.]
MKSDFRLPGLLAGSATLALAAAGIAAPAQAQNAPTAPDVMVVPNETTDSEQIVDNEGEFDGVGMLFRADGSVCTGSLINPRTVLFAAHCVNNRAASDYGPNGVPAAWSFNVDALPGFQDWFSNAFASNPDLAVFNVSQIQYDPRSLENPAAGGFIEADIALATLDTPAANIPTWAVLFSPLPDPGEIDPVTGTGYFVDIVGYGGTGTAATGASLGIDFRRRAAENILGGFFSLDDRNAILFGPGPESLSQNLYFTDFDSQDRSPFVDINITRDDARPNEGTTAGGDSGGPLILDAENNTLTDEDLVIGVLSGGSRVFGVPFSSIGTQSFYQPLFLYWQYIAANNPYRYVGTNGGDGAWEDPDHWVTLLDPAYRIIDESGAVVNGLPSTPELALEGTEGDFGAICIEFEGPGDFCTDLATGTTTPTFNAGASATAPDAELSVGVWNNRGQVTLERGGEATESDNRGFVDLGLEDFRSAASQPGGEAIAQEAVAEGGAGGGLPAPTLANGLPGASGFVPDNVDPVVSADPALAVQGRYFDVTLSGSGTTTLSSTVEIDRLIVRDSAGLAIDADGDLTSLINVSQFGGNVAVDGSLASIGDYTLFAGMLSGSGTIESPFVTSIMGAISPGEMGTIDTLTIDGNLVMSSGATLLADIDAAGNSDTLAVTGLANVGGVVGIGQGITGQVNGNGRTYTILTADGGVSGAFSETTISAILSQSFTYTENAVLMQIEAASYASVVDPDDPVQSAYAQLFDQNRSNDNIAEIFALDFADADTIRSTFNGLAPVTEAAVSSLTQQSVNLLQNFNDRRLRTADRSKAGGKIAKVGSPLEATQASFQRFGQPVGAGAMALQGGEGDAEVMDADLPENVALFLAGGIVSGEADPLPGYTGNSDMDGLYVAGGLEFYLGDSTMMGVSGWFSSVEADTALGQRAEADTFAGSLYARHRAEGGLILDGQLTLGSMNLTTDRRVDFLGNPQALSSDDSDTLFSAAVGASYDLQSGIGTLSPGVEARFASVDLSTVEERGGPLGLQVNRETYRSAQARGGLDYETSGDMFQVNATAQMVWEFEEGPQLLSAQFVRGNGPAANFVVDGADRTWGEVGIGATIGDGPVTVGFGFDATIGRSTADTRVWSAEATWRF